jgi:cytochrome c oxidase subunit 1
MPNESIETSDPAVRDAGETETVAIGVHDMAAAVAAGAVGVVAMVPSFLAAVAVGATTLDSFGRFAELFLLGPNLPVGAIAFAVGGVVVNPLVFASLAGYLPGRQWSTRGVVFGIVLLCGFLPGFYAGQIGLLLVAYVLLALFGHVSYGVALGTVYGRYQRADYAV